MAEFVLCLRVMQSANNDSRSITSSVGPAGERHELRFRFECETLEAFGALYAPDISRGGIFIRTLDVLPLAAPVKLELLLADESTFIEAEGLVFWTRGADQAGVQGEPGMGIRFTKMSQDSHRNLTHILAVKKAEDRIREAAAEAETEAEEDSWTEEENTLVATNADLRAAVVRGGGALTDAPTAKSAAPSEDSRFALLTWSDKTVLAAVDAAEQALAETAFAEEVRTSKAALVEVIAAPDSAIVSAPIVASPSGRSLSRPAPLLPDWAFVSTRFGAGTPAVDAAAAAAETETEAEPADGAVPQHIPDARDTSFGGPGSVATPAMPAPSGAPRRWGWLRQHTGLRLVAGAALVLIATLAVAPRHKRATPASARPRAGLVSPPAAANTARFDGSTTALEFTPTSERVVSQASARPNAARAR